VAASLGILLLVFVDHTRLDRTLAWARPADPLTHLAVLLAFVAFLVVLVAVPLGASTLPATRRFWRMGAGKWVLIAAWVAWLLLSLPGWAGSIGRLLRLVADRDLGVRTADQRLWCRQTTAKIVSSR
jgi:hypothetical protein